MGLVNHLERAKAILYIVEETLEERGVESVFFQKADENGHSELTATGRNVAARILVSLEDVLENGK